MRQKVLIWRTKKEKKTNWLKIQSAWLTQKFILRNSFMMRQFASFPNPWCSVIFQILHFTVDSFILKQQTKRARIWWSATLGANTGSGWRLLCVSATNKVASWRKNPRATLSSADAALKNSLTSHFDDDFTNCTYVVLFSALIDIAQEELWWSFAWFVNQGIA